MTTAIDDILKKYTDEPFDFRCSDFDEFSRSLGGSREIDMITGTQALDYFCENILKPHLQRAGFICGDGIDASVGSRVATEFKIEGHDQLIRISTRSEINDLWRASHKIEVREIYA